MQKSSFVFDVTGSILSIVCAIHCIGASLLVATLPVLALHSLDVGFAIVLFGFAGFALYRGIKVHGQLGVLLPFVLGALMLGFVWLKLAPRGFELFAALLASSFFILGHGLNSWFSWRERCSCGTCVSHDPGARDGVALPSKV